MRKFITCRSFSFSEKIDIGQIRATGWEAFFGAGKDLGFRIVKGA